MDLPPCFSSLDARVECLPVTELRLIGSSPAAARAE